MQLSAAAVGAKDAAAVAMAVAEVGTAGADVAVEAVGAVAVGTAKARVVVGGAVQAVVVEVAEAVRWQRANRAGSTRDACRRARQMSDLARRSRQKQGAAEARRRSWRQQPHKPANLLTCTCK